MKIVNIEEEMRNFNEIFGKDVTYENIKSHKKQGFNLPLKNTFLEKSYEVCVCVCVCGRGGRSRAKDPGICGFGHIYRGNP